MNKDKQINLNNRRQDPLQLVQMASIYTYNFSQLEEPESERIMELKAEEVGMKVRKIRLSKKMTQEDLAEAAGISANFVGEIERAETKVSALVLFKIASAMSVPICEILSTGECPYAQDERFKELIKALSARDESEINKALRVLEAFLE